MIRCWADILTTLCLAATIMTAWLAKAVTMFCSEMQAMTRCPVSRVTIAWPAEQAVTIFLVAMGMIVCLGRGHQTSLI